MQRVILSTSLVLFADLSSFIEPLKVEQIHKEAFPNYALTQQIEMAAGTPEIVWVFQEDNQRWVIRSSRIDYIVLGDVEEKTMTEAFLSIVEKLDSIGNRISLVCSTAYINLGTDELSNALRQLLPGFEDSPDFHELSIRYNRRKTISAGTGKETLNCIVSIAKGFVRKIPDSIFVPALTLQTDVNTLFENKTPRFSSSVFRELYHSLWEESRRCASEAEQVANIHEEN